MPEPIEAGYRQHSGLDLAPGDARVYVATQGDDPEIGPPMQELGAPPQGRSADDGALPEIGDASRIARDERIASIARVPIRSKRDIRAVLPLARRRGRGGTT